MMSKMASSSSRCELTDIDLDSDLESMELVSNSDCSESPPVQKKLKTSGLLISNYYCSTDGPSKTLILHDIYTDGQSCRLEALSCVF